MRVAALARAERLGYTEPDHIFRGREQLCATSYRNHTGVKDMPKKSTTARQAHAARRSQTTARPSQPTTRSQNVSLVRAPNAETPATDTAASTTVETTETPATPTTQATPKTSAADKAVTSSQPATSAAKSTTGAARTATATRPASKAAAKPATPASTAAKPAAKPAAQPQGSHAVREQERRIARAKEMRRIRNANVVTPEHYRYVIHDLRMTAILAIAMFAVIIVLHFVLG